MIASALLAFEISDAQISKKFIDPAHMDQTVKPGDNFYLYVNGNWIKNTPVPASKTRWGSFDQLSDESSKALKELLEDASKYNGSNTLMKRVGDYYASGMDSLAIEKLGYQPIKSYLAKVNTIKTKADVMKMVSLSAFQCNSFASYLSGSKARRKKRN